MIPSSTKICWHAAILIIISLVSPSTYADEDTDVCTMAHLNTLIKNLGSNTKEWKTNANTYDVQMQKLGQKFKEILDASENKITHCTAEEKQEFEHALAFAIKFSEEELEPSEEALKLVKDDEVVENIFVLVSCIKESYAAEFASALKDPSAKIRVYKLLTNLLQRTNLNNKLIDTSYSFVYDLNTIAREETDASVSEVLKNLLRQAIITDFRLEHENADKFYEMNNDLTSEIVHDLIRENVLAQESCNEDDLEPLHLYDVLKITSNTTLFYHHLELIFNELKKSPKMNSIHGVLLLHYNDDINELEGSEFDKFKENWHNFINEIPKIFKNIFSGYICNTENNTRYNIFDIVSQEGNKTLQFQPSDNGAKSVVTATLDGEDLIFAVDKLPATDFNFDFPVKIEHGNFVEFPVEGLEVPAYQCQHFKEPIESSAKYTKSEMVEYCRMEKVIESLISAF